MHERPMLAARKFEPHRVENQLPMFAQPKLDGIRLRVLQGQAVSRSNKPLPNKFLQQFVNRFSTALNGVDGEVIVGSPTARDVYHKTESAIMSQGGEPDFKLFLFDICNSSLPFERRFMQLVGVLDALKESVVDIHHSQLLPRLVVVPTDMVYSLDEVYGIEAKYLGMGYEGVMLRSPMSLYKNGRATEAQGQLVKLKRFIDTEATIVGFEELLRNMNEAETNELGLTSRSSHKDNKVAADTLGSLLCEGVFPDGRPYEVSVGTGFDTALRQQIWDNRDAYRGRVIKFKYLPVGVKDKPRNPVFLGFRDPIDM